jgi:DNA-binding beta-propeller fold protein YncE
MKPLTWGSLFLFLGMTCSSPAQNILAQIPIATNSAGQMAVDPALNLVYDAGGFNAGGNSLTVINGSTFAVVTNFSPAGGAAVDMKTDNYWTGDLFGGDVLVYSAPSNTLIHSSHLSGCPGQVNFDCQKRRMWVTAQCGGGNDPAWVLNADTFAIISGPIGSGGVMGPAITNPFTGKLYLTASGVSEEINPTTFAVTSTTFGTVFAVDTVLNRLYALSGSSVQIINGSSEAILKTISLTYTPNGLGFNNALSHLYASNAAAGTIEVRDSASGALLSTFSLGANASPGTMAVDSTRGRIYVNVLNPTTNTYSVYVIEDLSNTRKCRARGSC